MTQMSTEPMPLAVTVTPVSYLDVFVKGPGGLRVMLTIPDDDDAYNALDEFVEALPQAIRAGMESADKEANGAHDTSGPGERRWEANESDEAARAVEMQVPHA